MVLSYLITIIYKLFSVYEMNKRILNVMKRYSVIYAALYNFKSSKINFFLFSYDDWIGFSHVIILHFLDTSFVSLY